MFSVRMPSLVAASLIILVAGCASSPDPAAGAAGGQTAPASDEIRITIINNKFDAGRVAIWLAQDVGLFQNIGEMEAGETRVFVHKPGTGGRRLQLSAQSAAGTRVNSEFVNVPPNAAVTWDIQLNLIRARR